MHSIRGFLHCLAAFAGFPQTYTPSWATDAATILSPERVSDLRKLAAAEIRS